MDRQYSQMVTFKDDKKGETSILKEEMRENYKLLAGPTEMPAAFSYEETLGQSFVAKGETPPP